MPFLAHVRADHDETLVARLAANDLAPRELEAARAQVADCPACAELLADLRSIATATTRLPAPQRTRDFRLTEPEAARLRPAGWRGLLARLGSPGFAFTTPLAGGLAALGLAGLIFASLPSGLGGAAPSSGMFYDARDSAAGGAAPSAAPAPALVPAAPSGGRTATAMPGGASGASQGVGVTNVDGGTTKGAPEVAAPPTAGDGGAPLDATAERNLGLTAEPPSPLLILSLVLLVAGIVLGALRLVGRRFT